MKNFIIPIIIALIAACGITPQHAVSDYQAYLESVDIPDTTVLDSGVHYIVINMLGVTLDTCGQDYDVCDDTNDPECALSDRLLCADKSWTDIMFGTDPDYDSLKYIFVESGDYRPLGRLALGTYVDSFAHPIEFIFSGGFPPALVEGLYIDTAANLTFSGITFSGYGLDTTGGTRAYPSDIKGSSGIVIDNCSFSNAYNEAINVYNTSDLRVQNSKFAKTICGDTGAIKLDLVHLGYIVGNTFNNKAVHTIGERVDSLFIIGNTIYNNITVTTSEGTQGYTGAGMEIAASGEGKVQIFYNNIYGIKPSTCSDSLGVGIKISDDSVVVKHNHISFSQIGIEARGSDSVIIIDSNVFININSLATTTLPRREGSPVVLDPTLTQVSARGNHFVGSDRNYVFIGAWQAVDTGDIYIRYTRTYTDSIIRFESGAVHAGTYTLYKGLNTKKKKYIIF